MPKTNMGLVPNPEGDKVGEIPLTIPYIPPNASP
jgi:hypothetical protein